MKGAVLTLAASIAVLAAIVQVSAWAPWESKDRGRELAWVEAYTSWSDGIGDALVDGRRVAIPSCEARFEKRVGGSPTSRLELVSEAAKRSCGALGSDDPETDWWEAQDDVAWRLFDVHRRAAKPVLEVDLSRVATPIARRKARAYCWPEDDWERLNEQDALIRRSEFWAIGLADTRRGDIHLAPVVCDSLRRFFRSRYAPYLSYESYELAEALVTLAHEAEHLRQPDAPEAVVECNAMQRVRGIVRGAGRRRSYEREMAGLAWQVGYPAQYAAYRTRECRDGGPLDLDRESSVWP